MNYDGYKQLNKYSLYDGIYLAVIWVGAFACTFTSSVLPFLATFSNMLILCTPFFVAYRLRIFRDEALGGEVSFGKSMLYCFRVFLNAALLFCILEYAYFQFIDNGQLALFANKFASSPEGAAYFSNLGIKPSDVPALLAKVLTPTLITFASFIELMIAGFFGSLIVSAIMSKKKNNAQ